jgi:prepilin-type N-terminal cleavage/methylation domain-containing protein
MKKKKGVTLIEILVAMILMVIMMVAFSNVYIFSMKTYGEQFVQTRLSSEAETLVDRISTDINLAQGVEGTYSTYTTSQTTIILLVPAIDASQNFIYSNGVIASDRIIYYKVGTNLHRIIYAINNSARFSQNGQDAILSKLVTGLTFTYDPDMVSPVKVTTSITVSQKAGKKTQNITVTGKSGLRNN